MRAVRLAFPDAGGDWITRALADAELLALNVTDPNWRTSSCSGANGNCIEVADKLAPVWHTSSRSGGNGNCVEVADNLVAIVAVRDSKDRSGPVLTFRPAAWTAFTASIKLGAVAS